MLTNLFITHIYPKLFKFTMSNVHGYGDDRPRNRSNRNLPPVNRHHQDEESRFNFMPEGLQEMTGE